MSSPQPSLRSFATPPPCAIPLKRPRIWLDEHGKVALATVASTWGSAPVPVGGQLVVAPDERFQGSVSGGCVEADVIAEAASVMASGRPRLLEFGVTEETAWRAGLPCGGKIKVLLEPLARGRDLKYLERKCSRRGAREHRWWSRPMSSPDRARCLHAGSNLTAGGKGQPWQRRKPAHRRPEGAIFVQALLAPVRIVIAGATNIGQVLADMARQAGYDVVVVDPRTAFLAAERFAGSKTIGAWPAASLSSLGLDARTAVVALTHAAHIDDEALGAALRSPCLYIGALGSKGHARQARRAPARAGFEEAEIARIHAPIGLAIGAKGPAEIAVSILAEIIKVVREA